MGDITEANQKADAALAAATLNNERWASVDTKLDDVRAFIETLRAGVPVTQQQLDELIAKIDAVGTAVTAGVTQGEAVFAEADALDE